MAKRRSSGEGAVYKNSAGKWVGQIDIGRNPTDGKRIRRTYYGRTKSEVLDKIHQVKHECKQGNYLEPSETLLADWLDSWLEGRKHSLAESTYDAYETMIRCHIKPHLGDVKLKDLTTRHIQILLNEKFESGRIDGKGGLSARTVKYIYQTLRSAIQQAVKERLLIHNIVEAAELPRMPKKEMKTILKEDIPKFLKEASKSPHYAAFILALASGVRRGELLGLSWDKINWDKSCITINQQLIKTKKGAALSYNLKRLRSYRTIPLDPSIMTILKAHQEKQSKMKELYLGATTENTNKGDSSENRIYNNNNLVFCTNDGKPLDPDNFVRHYKMILNRAQMPEIRFHDLRHTFATLSLEAGVSLKAIQETLGHSSISITGDVYSHVTAKMKNEAAQKISSVLITDSDTDEN